MFEAKAKDFNISPLSLELANKLDAESTTFRDDFLIPKVAAVTSNKQLVSDQEAAQDSVYLCGNSLGLQPKGTQSLIQEEMQVWAKGGVTGHFRHEFDRPWVSIDDHVTLQSAKIVGAKQEEVVIMNSLTANIHFMMVSFYVPTPTRFKIIMEAKAFPSDYFAIESQVRFHGYDPETAIIQIEPREGEFCLDPQEILRVIKQHGDSVAFCLMSGVQYYTGQLFDIETITKAGHEMIACWCTYKYLNAGPGGIGGAFIHERHLESLKTRPMFAGWWGSNEEVKFEMDLDFKPILGAKGYRLSNPCVLAVVALKGSLDVFEKTTMKALVKKSKELTAYLEFLIDSLISPQNIKIITPRDQNQRGCQLSLWFPKPGTMMPVFEFLAAKGVVCDERKPDVIRIAPAPLYNTFSDVWRVVDLIRKGLESI